MKSPPKVLRRVGDYIGSIDRWLLLGCLILSTASVVFLYGLNLAGSTSVSRAITQVIAIAIGLVAAFIISFFDYKMLVRLWKLYVPLCVILVGLTFVIGTARGSNRAWLNIPIQGMSFSIQPSEFLKISFITTFSLHLNHVKEQLNKLSNLLLLCVHAGAHILLIIIQKDDGTALVFFGIFLVMIFLAGLSWKYLLAGMGVVAVAAPIVWFKIMSVDQQLRFLVLRDPKLNVDYSYQQMQGLKSLGVGGIRGIGFFGENHVRVPESYNDFLFTFIGEAAGLIGVLAILVLLLSTCYRLICNGNQAADITGRMICMGVMAMILVQSVMNIGMCINLLPVIGVPLPFLSAGGSSSLAMYLGIGLAMSVYRHGRIGLFD